MDHHDGGNILRYIYIDSWEQLLPPRSRHPSRVAERPPKSAMIVIIIIIVLLNLIMINNSVIESNNH